MAKQIVKVEGGTPEPEKKFVAAPEAKKKAATNRIIAAILWVLALASEGGAIWFLRTVLQQSPVATKNLIFLIAFIVIDVVLVIVGSSLWKKANRLDPASKKDKFRFFVQNQLGVIISVIAFLPLIILIFTNKNMSGKQKGIVGAIAIVALLGAGLLSADFNPPSVEQYSEQISEVETLTGQNAVFWTESGTHYHLYSDCHTINKNATKQIYEGTVQQARELKNIVDLCSFCRTKAEKLKAVLPEATEAVPLGEEETEADNAGLQ